MYAAQVRQLLLDPAVHREFQRLHHDAESKAQEIKQLKDELKAVSFSQESKAGRLLMAKCRTLQASLSGMPLAHVPGIASAALSMLAMSLYRFCVTSNRLLIAYSIKSLTVLVHAQCK